MHQVKYQVMPPLSPDEYQDLFDDIRRNGVLEPIHIDNEGVVIDGHHRSKIANELGIPCPVIVHDELDESGKRSLAFTLNLKRRHLNREQRRALIAESLKSDPQLSNREHAKRAGAGRDLVGIVRKEMESEGQLSESDSRISADGRVRPSTQPKPAPVTDLISSDELDEINEPVDVPEQTTPPADVQETDEDVLVKIGMQLRKAEKAIREARLLAHQLDSWPGAPLSDDARHELDALDEVLKSGGLNAELQRLIQEENDDR